VPKTKGLECTIAYNNIQGRFPNHVFLYQLCFNPINLRLLKVSKHQVGTSDWVVNLNVTWHANTMTLFWILLLESPGSGRLKIPRFRFTRECWNLNFG